MSLPIRLYVDGEVQMEQHKPYGIYEKYLKRPLDAFLASCALIVLAPVLLITAILVRIKLGSPVLMGTEVAK